MYIISSQTIKLLMKHKHGQFLVLYHTKETNQVTISPVSAIKEYIKTNKSGDSIFGLSNYIHVCKSKIKMKKSFP